MSTLQPNTAQIRQALNNAFDDVKFDALCFDYFTTVYDDFSRGLRKDEKIGMLLDHCRRTPSGFSSLLAAVRQEYLLSDGRRDELTPLIEQLEASLELLDSIKSPQKQGLTKNELEIIERIVLYLSQDQQRLGTKVLLTELLSVLALSLSEAVIEALDQLKSINYIQKSVTEPTTIWLTNEGKKRIQDFQGQEESQGTIERDSTGGESKSESNQIEEFPEFSWTLEGLDARCAHIVQRQDLLAKIQKILEGGSGKKTAFLYGPPRVGKTFLLERLQERLRDRYVAVVVHLSGWASIAKLSTFLYELATRIKSKLEFLLTGIQIEPFRVSSDSEATIEFSKFMNQLVHYVRAQGRVLLLMFDELEYLVRERTDQRIFEYLSGCIESYSDQQVRFLFACSGHMVDLVKHGSLAKLWAKGKAVKISCFDEEISRDLISTLTKPYLSLDTKALDIIVRLGNGQPTLLRHTLPFLVESWKNKEHSNKISENDLVDMLEEICIELSVELGDIWSRLSSLEQHLLLRIAQHNKSGVWEQGFKQDEVVMGNEPKMRECLKRLVRLQILDYASQDKLYMVRLGVIVESLSCGILSVSESLGVLGASNDY